MLLVVMRPGLVRSPLERGAGGVKACVHTKLIVKGGDFSPPADQSEGVPGCSGANSCRGPAKCCTCLHTCCWALSCGDVRPAPPTCGTQPPNSAVLLLLFIPWLLPHAWARAQHSEISQRLAGERCLERTLGRRVTRTGCAAAFRRRLASLMSHGHAEHLGF